MKLPTVSQIWRYPVKSMQGERLDHATITELGVEFDRGWGVRDRKTGTVLTGRREPQLLMCSARVVDGELEMLTPKGAVIGGALDAVSDALSAHLGRAVAVERAAHEGGTYEVPLDIDRESDWVAWTGPGGAWHDSTRTRVSVLSAASCDGIEPLRFRANVLIDAPAGSEVDWVGGTIGVGDEVRLDVTKRIDRCVMVARPIPGHDAALGALKHVIRNHDNCMGIGALVAHPGNIAVGDGVALVAAD